MHVGLPRCASTTIEYAFLRPEYEPYQRLVKSGINPLHRLSVDFRRTANLSSITDDMCRMVREHYLPALMSDEYRGYFATDESFTAFQSMKGARTVFADRARFMAKFLEGFQPRILLLVRNQVSIVESYYGLHLQSGGTLSFQDFYAQFPLRNLNWLAVAEAFAKEVGEENLTVLPFERGAYGDDVPYGDFIEAFFRIMEVDDPMCLADLPVANQSLDPQLFPAQARLNRELDPESAKTAFMILLETYPRQKGGAKNMLTDAQKQALRERFQPTNETLFRRFMPDFDGTSYLPA